MRLTNIKVRNLKYEGRDKKVFDGQGSIGGTNITMPNEKKSYPLVYILMSR